MNIDDRLEKLTERHEALTRKLELLSRDVQNLRAAISGDGETVVGLLAAVQIDAENIRALARIAESR